MSQPSEIYRNISSMEPMLPSIGRAILAELSVEIFSKSGELKASLPSVITRIEVAKLVREMNSYYSNLIEGHKTLPRDIEKALKDEYAEGGDNKRNQQLSVAHVRAERAMEKLLRESPEIDVFDTEFICWLHEEFYSHIPETEWFTTSRDGTRYALEPGKIRDYNVDVGRHTPPDHSSIPEFLTRFREVYANPNILSTNKLIAAAAAHQRLLWIHPFGDGNGRVARLHSQAVLTSTNLSGDGLWTLSRGLARAKPTYYQLLQAADQPRANDIDGRGNLSEKALTDFCEFFLKQILDQLEFMVGLISPFHLQDRVESYFRFKRVDLSPKTRENFAKLVKALCIQGEMARGEVGHVLGLKGTASREVIKEALEEEIVSTSSEKGPIRIAFPSKVADYYFPELFTDLPVDQ